MTVLSLVRNKTKALLRGLRLRYSANRWGSDHQSFNECAGRPFLFFSPHQDDELISFATPIAELSLWGFSDKTQVVLCSDGSRSRVASLLGNGSDCELHDGQHERALSPEELAATRDLEFIASCEALGVPTENIHIPSNRATDGDLSVRAARSLIEAYLRDNPDAVVCTFGPSNHGFERAIQHGDHRNLGQAALDLYREGAITTLFQFIEPSGVENFKVNNPGTRLSPMVASPGAAILIDRAVRAYYAWDPEAGRFAVGAHSVRQLIDDTAADKTSYFFTPAPADVCSPRKAR